MKSQQEEIKQQQQEQGELCKCRYRKAETYSLRCLLKRQEGFEHLCHENGLWKLDDNLIQRFSLKRIFTDNQSTPKSLDWDSSRDCLLSCYSDGCAALHSVSRNTRKYGAHSARFVEGCTTHCIVASKSSTAQTRSTLPSS